MTDRSKEQAITRGKLTKYKTLLRETAESKMFPEEYKARARKVLELLELLSGPLEEETVNDLLALHPEYLEPPADR